MCIKLHHHQEHDVRGLPCRQRSLPGCGFGVVVNIVHSPMRQHPLFPAATREMHCISLYNIVSKDKKHNFTIHLITANSTPWYQLYLESTEGIPHYGHKPREILMPAQRKHQLSNYLKHVQLFNNLCWIMPLAVL